ncbi:hypothetical protein LTR56_025444 [Elasticomyces elasticus]|nr:hypothetical protein LTR56_025444 [Elasticomyces elasticus]KAK3624790.1 hypothetical protein LTR22_023829 [Elasticomyces elasticus]KAK4904818.1 hypothetical protein LTR49_025799 [Elasticomyces elasticus]KAK5748820.1 hypothetical protein LTS12_021117 [Elasticomyces elasticus]
MLVDVDCFREGYEGQQLVEAYVWETEEEQTERGALDPLPLAGFPPYKRPRSVFTSDTRQRHEAEKHLGVTRSTARLARTSGDGPSTSTRLSAEYGAVGRCDSVEFGADFPYAHSFAVLKGPTASNGRDAVQSHTAAAILADGEIHDAQTMELEYDWIADPAGYYELTDLDMLLQAPGTHGEPACALNAAGEVLPQVDEHDKAAAITKANFNSASSGESIRDILNRIRYGSPDKPKTIARHKKALSISGQKCGVCGKLYETSSEKLRKHLETHADELRAVGTWPKCPSCEVGFVYEQDLKHHLHRVQSGYCCGLDAVHEGPCKGYRCGFNFHHEMPCNGHHPPNELEHQLVDSCVGPSSDFGRTWSDHDRFRFGHLLRKWELSQLQSVMTEVRNVLNLRSLGISSKVASLPEMLLYSSFARASGFSWASERSNRGRALLDLEAQMRNLRLTSTQGPLKSDVRRSKNISHDLDEQVTSKKQCNIVHSRLRFRKEEYTGASSNRFENTGIDPSTITWLWYDPANLCQLSLSGISHLDHAVACLDVPLVRSMLARGAHWIRGIHALFMNCSCGSDQNVDIQEAEITMIRMLSAQNNVDRRDAHGHTALYRAALHRRHRMVDALLDAGADPTCMTLHAALLLGNRTALQLVPRLIDAGADVNEQDEFGNTPFYYASQQKYPLAFQDMLRAGGAIMDTSPAW